MKHIKNQNGISLITLIVVVVVMIILVGVVGMYSLENILKSKEANSEVEFSSVREFTLNMNSRIILEDYKFNTNDIELPNDLLTLLIGDRLTNTDINNIVDVNSADLPDVCKYYYISSTSKKFEDRNFTEGNIQIQDVKEDYIINFYTGTIIQIGENSFKVEGLIKGLAEVVVMLEE